MSMKSVSILGFAAALFAFAAVPANANVNPAASAAEASEASVTRPDDATPSNRGGSVRASSSVRVSARASVRVSARASVRQGSSRGGYHSARGHARFGGGHRPHSAHAHTRFGGGHRASPVRTAHNGGGHRASPVRMAHNGGGVRHPRPTHNTRVQTNRPQVRRTATTNPRPNWRNNPILNVRSG